MDAAKRGCRYSLALILTLLLLARLAGETEIRAAAQWIRLRKGWIIEQLHLTRASLPCQGTYLYALERIDAQELLEVVAGCLTRWEAGERCENEASRLNDLGGKQEKQHVAKDWQNHARHPRTRVGGPTERACALRV